MLEVGIYGIIPSPFCSPPPLFSLTYLPPSPTGFGGGQLRHHGRGRAAEARQERAHGRAREDAPEAEQHGPRGLGAAERSAADEPAAAADDVVPRKGRAEPEHPAEPRAAGAGAAPGAGRPGGTPRGE